ncbi:two-component system sensor histidine kinase DesK [Streptomyces africanus]|uniref:Two-component system sensor histidine kinase DesK n=1 Tax=Streptomyces africanus TaxID=231024 RepID=A0ABU0QLL8_9ACTN|nr:histidine kinase [Streptomyces africanus]MDQ0748256.1 two-component system sensor histidine kinase DesK [Streptomyces africanus]
MAPSDNDGLIPGFPALPEGAALDHTVARDTPVLRRTVSVKVPSPRPARSCGHLHPRGPHVPEATTARDARVAPAAPPGGPAGTALMWPAPIGAAVVLAVQLVFAAAVAVHPLQDVDSGMSWLAVAAAVLCAWPASTGLRPPRGRQVGLAALAAVLVWVLPPLELAYVALSTVVSAVGAGALRRVTKAMAASRTGVRAERRRLQQERQRLRRDLHDLVGYSLSAVVVQADLLNRRLTQERGATVPEAAELARLTRQALAEIRALSAGAQRLSLAVELASVQRVLAAAEIRTVVKGTVPPVLDPDVQDALASVLREGTTNLLRHSDARSCRITVRRGAGELTLHMSNDGYGAHGGEGTGTGLRSLTERVAAVGGTLTWSHDGDRFQLCARCPVV